MYKYFLVSLLILTVISCTTLNKFTLEVVDKYEITETNIGNVQFYLSDPVTLKRIEEKVEKSIEEAIKYKTEKVNKLIVIDAKTPGIAIDKNETSIDILFDEGIVFHFESVKEYKQNKNVFKLTEINKSKIIEYTTYKNNQYEVLFSAVNSKSPNFENLVPILLYELKSEFKTSTDTYKVKGVRVADQKKIIPPKDRKKVKIISIKDVEYLGYIVADEKDYYLFAIEKESTGPYQTIYKNNISKIEH